jgi:hypothetical protein
MSVPTLVLHNESIIFFLSEPEILIRRSIQSNIKYFMHSRGSSHPEQILLKVNQSLNGSFKQVLVMVVLS